MDEDKKNNTNKDTIISQTVNFYLRFWLATLILFVLALILAGFAIYFYYQSSNYKQQLLTIEESSDQKNLQVVDRVGELVEIPTDQSPTVIKVTSLDDLADKPFFKQVKLGDYVLVYKEWGKVILYNPDLDKIVEIAPLSPESSDISQDLLVHEQQDLDIKIRILNGTRTTGLAASVSEKISNLGYKNIEVGNFLEDVAQTSIFYIPDNENDFKIIIKELSIQNILSHEANDQDSHILIILGEDYDQGLKVNE